MLADLVIRIYFMFLTLFYIYHYMYYYLQDSNAYCLCLAFILFISTIMKRFGYNFDILLIARHYAHLLTLDFMASLMYMLSLKKTEYSIETYD